MSAMSDKQSQLPDEGQISNYFQLMVQSEVNVEKFLLPTIACVTNLSDLVRQVRKINDVKLKPSNTDKKSLFPNPESFKSCLMKLCNETVNSLDETSNNLLKIRNSCKGITNHLENFLKAQASNQPSDKQLNSIQTCAIRCKEKADSVEQKLFSLSGLYCELLERCADSQIASQDKLEEIREFLGKASERNMAIKKAKSELDNEWSQVSQGREEVLNKYADVSSSAHVDEFCVEGLKKMKEMLPEIVDFFSKVTNPVQLAVELGKGLVFLTKLIADLSGKGSSESNLEISKFLSMVREQAEQKIKEVKRELEKSQSKYKDCYENMKRLDAESEQLSRAIQGTQSQEEAVKTNLQLMVEGLEVLGNIQSNWSDMIKFIQCVPKLTESFLKTFAQFGSNAEGIPECAPEILASNQIQVSQAVSIMNIIEKVSETYVQIYEDYLQTPLRDLSSLLGGQGSDNKFNDIQRKCETAKEKIRDRVTQKQEAFTKNGTEAIKKL
ncbi:uncharacterized protein LOC132205996 [Stegostoma tigrinum]|uniref:uncharacterized protein LOC132205996 n=1 Tax=Stegostoma tigrinum TaxID=3053191 RepID=UPI0028700F9D|nr:uncharacterized protein LOC132205996 [Stegostoma tigrinum]XP_059504824.1 uncharacterized protein LOC132205996 [Stegostoma tigrinum]